MVTQEQLDHWKVLPETRAFLRKLEERLLLEKLEAWKRPTWEGFQESRGRILGLTEAVETLKNLEEE